MATKKRKPAKARRSTGRKGSSRKAGAQPQKPRATSSVAQPDPAPVGRPSLYQLEYADQARKLCLLGATDAELGDFFGVSEVTINAWKQEYPEFLKSIKEGKEFADANVADRLYQRAMGYEHDAVKILTVSQGDNQGAVVEEVPYVERYAPDTTAAIFWLKNRQSKRWRDRQEVAHGAGDDVIRLIAEAFAGKVAP